MTQVVDKTTVQNVIGPSNHDTSVTVLLTGRIEELQPGNFRAMPAPKFQQILLPSDHLAQDQDDRDGGKADEQHQRIGLFHGAQAFFVTQNLHHSDSAVSNGRPIHRTKQEAARQVGAGAVDQ